MAENEAKTAEDAGKVHQAKPPEESATPTASTPVWQRLLSNRVLAGLIVGSIVLHGIGFWFYRVRHPLAVEVPHGEVSLGAFHYLRPDADNLAVTKAEFKLHVQLLPDLANVARQRLAQRKFKLQQDIEELLRQAHDADFEDPLLAGLKHQLQEQINKSLGVRAIDEVIITDLELNRASPAKGLAESKEHQAHELGSAG